MCVCVCGDVRGFIELKITHNIPKHILVLDFLKSD